MIKGPGDELEVSFPCLYTICMSAKLISLLISGETLGDAGTDMLYVSIHCM